VRRSPARRVRAALALGLAAALAAAPAAAELAAPPAASSRPALAPDAAPPLQDPAARLRAIVALVDDARERAGAPGLRDEERDALAELAWAQLDEALADPALSGAAGRDPDFLQLQALLLMDDGEDEQALAALERLQRIAPDDPETHRLLALCQIGLGNPASAAESYRRALALGARGAAGVRANLAYALASAGLRREALEESARAIAEDPDDYEAHFVRGWILTESGLAEEGRGEYRRAGARARDDAELWSLLAQSWERAGDAARANEAWREVARINPSDAHALAPAAGAASGSAPEKKP
jgi:Tfp pilus assembly protein PilF